MNQTAIGGYIARKRKEQNLTQEQLAQQLGVSNKTISKWENGVSHIVACFPPTGKHHIIMIGFSPQFKFQRNFCSDLRFHTKGLQSQFGSSNFIRLFRR